jgi:hypothetical protein
MYSSNGVIDFMPMSDRWYFGIPADDPPVDRTGIDLAGAKPPAWPRWDHF